MTGPRYDRNRSRIEDVRAHLLACDGAFVPPLATRVSIPGYAARLVSQAERFEAWAGSDLIGLVAVYCNAPDRHDAFVTNVSVVPEQTRRGIGRRLLLGGIAHARSLSFDRLLLSVDHRASALGLYRSLGFRGEATDGETLRLFLELQEEAVP
ncbi:GNAT family N-acetyltransferase [Methylobacterium iners]|uniref:N-acetyltransferase domain-containing protein n=1 Tax=Methylobacterium iners TaxID=418707 RepID=A0ABQ4S373_9HYPH|nr:GNAT family N-acetyltransferase [Methylobacterium iners]GJD96135.1 hypothetical protein OCOJLMKI_3353 [Methylobacterium iners]